MTPRHATTAPGTPIRHDADGHPLCRWCGERVPKGCRTFCGKPACVREWQIRTSGNYARQCVKERDHGVCALCGVDTEAVRRELEADVAATQRRIDEWVAAVRAGYAGPWSVEWDSAHERAMMAHYRAIESAQSTGRLAILYAERAAAEAYVARGFVRGRPLWEADHIVPVVRGGGSTGLENLRTLCVPCHRRETAQLAADRARERREARQPGLRGVP